MPTGTAEEWSRIAARLEALPAAIEGYIESLRLAASRGDVAPRRQVQAGITQSEDNLGPDGFFAGFVAGARDGSMDEPVPDSAARRPRPRGAGRPGRLPAAARLPRRGADRPGTGRRRHRRRALPGAVAPVPRRDGGSGGDLRLGAGGGRPDPAADGRGGRRDQVRRLGRRGDRRAGRRPGPQAARHRRAAGLDAGTGRRRHRGAVRQPLRDLRAGPAAGVPDRAHPHRRHLLHRPVRRLLPSGPDVVVGAGRRDRVLHLARADHRLPRGRARPSPAGRAGRGVQADCSTAGAGWRPGCPGTARAGRCTPSG